MGKGRRRNPAQVNRNGRIYTMSQPRGMAIIKYYPPSDNMLDLGWKTEGSEFGLA
jgi:hypothetical protein